MISVNQAHVELVHTAARIYNLDPALVCAVVEQESNWDTWAARYEPAFYDRYIRPLIDRGEVKTATEGILRSTSFGLMQVMGQTAREHGFLGRWLTQLCDPPIGIDMGCRVLKDKIKTDVWHGLQAYNGGGDPNYADEVLARMPKYTEAGS